MARKSNHVVLRKSGGWAVMKSGSTRASKTFETKKEATAYGVQISKREGAELYVHKIDGTIQMRNTYGYDPFPPRDLRN